MDEILTTLKISASGMRAQGTRLRVIAENLANASTLPEAPGQSPYRRRMVTFRNVLDAETGARSVDAVRITTDKTAFPKTFDPSHPAADEAGYVLKPNVNPLIEMADMREAQRSYEANLNLIRASKTMLQETIEILR
jgi:flagellar basal-body rod protein FlgC